MKKNYFRLAALALTVAAALPAVAVEFPLAQTPVDGGTYFLASRTNASWCWSRTPWDGAYYLLPFSDATPSTFTAHQAADGTWYFSVENGEDGVAFTNEPEVVYYGETYVGFPYGTDNLNATLALPAYWTLESAADGLYRLKAGTGQVNEETIGGYLHLNSGNTFAVLTEPTNPWFPDFYGGIERDELGDPVYDEQGFVVPVNPLSRLWAFISPDDAAAYALKSQLYEWIQGLEDDYIDLYDYYGTGFTILRDALLPLYNKDEVTADDVATAKAMYTAKMALYREIEQAEEIYGEGETISFKFNDAIWAAIEVFKTSNDVATLQQAVADLQEAEQAYILLDTNLTKLVKNNSFEDLSSQDGAMTSGVAAPPTGWNVFVRGQQVTTVAEANAAGLNGWHGINDDAEGALDGQYAFGLWNASVPQYELSQTIDGLDNGSYTITAALMVGANGDGSRRTTQRIFGNLNATYFGARGDYNLDELDQSEVYGFEGLEEPVTDRQLQELSVRAFVYDGTLTLGLRTDGNIAAAGRTASNVGDGWFKVDNFRLVREGYIQDDALEIYYHFRDQLDALADLPMQLSVLGLLEELTQSSIGSNSSEEETIAVIVAMKNLYPLVQASVALYARLEAAIAEGRDALDTYSYSATADDFQLLLDDAIDMWEGGEAGEEEIDAMIARLAEGIEQLKSSTVELGDITYVLKNPGFEDLSAQGGMNSGGVEAPPTGWTLKLNGTVYTEAPYDLGMNWCAINSGDVIDVTDPDGTYWDHQYTEGTHLWGIWSNAMPEVELSQTLKGMPEGTYTLTVDVLVQNNGHDNITTQRIFGNNNVTMYGSEYLYTPDVNLPEDAAKAGVLNYAGYTCEDGDRQTDIAHPVEVTFDVTANGVLAVGFRTNGIGADGEQLSGGWGWFKLDNFRLSYDSTELTAVKGVTTEGEAGSAVEYYSIDGRRLHAPQRGLNIIRVGGKTTKIVAD